MIQFSDLLVISAVFCWVESECFNKTSLKVMSIVLMVTAILIKV